MPYVGLTPTELVVCLALGFLGLCAVCLALVLLAASVIRRDVDEHAFRQELRRALDREDYAPAEREREPSIDSHGMRRHAILVGDLRMPERRVSR